MRFAGLAIGGADERHANTQLTQVHQYSAMENFIVWMSEDDEQRRAA
jgi:hypothetical protein